MRPLTTAIAGFPLNFSRSLTLTLTLRGAIACVVAGVSVGLVGCDAGTSAADKQVRTDVASAQSATTPDGAIKALNEATRITGISASTSAVAKAALARTEFAQAMRIANQVARNEIDLHRLALEMEQLRALVETGNTMVASYQKHDPAGTVTKINAMIAKATGQGADGFWIDEGETKFLTQNALKQKISQLQQQEASLVAKVNELTSQRSAALEQGETLTRESLSQSGKESVETYNKGAAQRREAAARAIEIDQANSALVPVRADLAVAQGQLMVVDAAIAQLSGQVKQLNAGWAQVKEQIDAQLASSKRIVGDTSTQDQVSIAAKGVVFSNLAKSTSDLRESAVSLLNDASRHYGEAVTDADRLRQELQARTLDPALADAPEMVAWKAMLQTVDPVLYKVQQASALQALATLHAGRASVLAALDRLSKSVAPTLKTAGLTTPSELTDGPGDALARARAEAGESYKAASDLLAGVMEVPVTNTSPARLAYGKVGRATALYGLSQLAIASGDAATEASLIREAADVTSSITELPHSALPVFPERIRPKPVVAELAPAPTVEPAPAVEQ